MRPSLDRTDDSLDRPGHRWGQHQGRPRRRAGADRPVRGLEATRRAGAGDRGDRGDACRPATGRRRDDDGRALRLLSDQGASGVNAVLDAVIEALPGRSIVGLGRRRRSSTRVEEVRERPMLAAAANWLALATLAARLVPDDPATLDRHRHDHDRPDPAGSRGGRGPGAERHRAAPDRRARLRRRAPHAGLRPGDRAAASEESPPAWRPSSSPRRSTST